jgi:hypothetical protein
MLETDIALPAPLASSLKPKKNLKMDVVRILFKDGNGKPGIFLKLMVKPYNFFYETCYDIQDGKKIIFKNNFYFL